jgi:hypothetical protein
VTSLKSLSLGKLSSRRQASGVTDTSAEPCLQDFRLEAGATVARRGPWQPLSPGNLGTTCHFPMPGVLRGELSTGSIKEWVA